MDPEILKKSFGFVNRKRTETGQDVPFYCVSASNGVNVVALFQDSIKKAVEYKDKGGDTFVDQVLEFIKEEEKRPDGIFSNKSSIEL
jgi:Rab-like protein 2